MSLNNSSRITVEDHKVMDKPDRLYARFFAGMHDLDAPFAVVTTAESGDAVTGQPALVEKRCAASQVIAESLMRAGAPAVTPEIVVDTAEGIASAIRAGARVLFFNTEVSASHLAQAGMHDIGVIGQPPQTTRVFEDKWETRGLLNTDLCAKAVCIRTGEPMPNAIWSLEFPVVLKPRRGLCGVGVRRFDTRRNLHDVLKDADDGTEWLVEEFAPGLEASITIMPPGDYRTKQEIVIHEEPWCLPVLARTGHNGDGIAPAAARGDEPIIDGDKGLLASMISLSLRAQSRFPMRVDARKDRSGRWCILDVNSKPDLGWSAHRKTLIGQAMMAMQWSQEEMLWSIYRQAWRI